MAKINVRSPYYIYYTVANLTSAVLDVYIYTGTQTTSRPGTPTYSIDNLAYGTNKVLFEISELVRDYLDITFDGDYTSQMVWVDYEITPSISGTPSTALGKVALAGFDGFGYFTDGPQNQSTDINTGPVLQSNTIIYKRAGYSVRIPVEASSTFTVDYSYEGEIVKTQSISAATTDATRIVYVQDYFTLGQDNYKARVLADSGTFEETPCVDCLEENSDLANADAIWINGVKYIIKTISERKYEPYKVTFVNKFGALQDMWFFKKSQESMSTESSEYNTNIITDGSYTTNLHSSKIMSKNGVTSLKLSSGFIDEDYNETFRQLLLSEAVWITYNEMVLPIKIKTNSIDFLTRVNDKLIDYRMTAEFAYNTINNIR